MKLSLPVNSGSQVGRGFIEKTHRGNDYGWFLNNPTVSQMIYSAAPGVVESVEDYAGFNSGWGNRTFIRHTSRAKTSYNHVRNSGFYVSPEQLVTRKQLIAAMGNTGDSDGIHLHFELWIDGKRVDPSYYFNNDLPGESVTTAGEVISVYKPDINKMIGNEEMFRVSDSKAIYLVTSSGVAQLTPTEDAAIQKLGLQTINFDSNAPIQQIQAAIERARGSKLK